MAIRATVKRVLAIIEAEWNQGAQPKTENNKFKFLIKF
jgi:hypothetical protein